MNIILPIRKGSDPIPEIGKEHRQRIGPRITCHQAFGDFVYIVPGQGSICSIYELNSRKINFIRWSAVNSDLPTLGEYTELLSPFSTFIIMRFFIAIGALLLAAGCVPSSDSSGNVNNTTIAPQFKNNISTLFGSGGKVT